MSYLFYSISTCKISCELGRLSIKECSILRICDYRMMSTNNQNSKLLPSTKSSVPSLYPSKKTFSEEKYGITALCSQDSSDSERIISLFSKYCQNEGITWPNIREKSRFIQPSHSRRQLVYSARKRKFNQIVREKILEICDVQYGSSK